MLNNTQNKDKDRCIIFVLYRELYHTTIYIRDDAPIKRKLSLENRNIYSPLPFISAMGLIKSKGNDDFFYTNENYLVREFYYGHCNQVMTRIRCTM